MMTIARVRASFAVVVGLICAGLLAGCAASATPAASGATPAGLTVVDGFARPAPSGGAGGAFLTVVNPGGEPDRLVAARSPVAPACELHETIDDNGVMRMRPVPGGFEVPAKGKLELKPGGKHVMFLNMTEPLRPGQEVEITLTFEKAGDITIKVPVDSERMGSM